MPIIQISRIQHRRGLREDLPNLASAELGWCIDTRQLFIGNGTLAEGAPTLGRTEVLTEYSDLFGKFGSYTYSGEEATGYQAITGSSSVDPTQRTLQGRLDDFVSVISFGATGDGVTDDTDAINRALYQLYCREPIPAARKTLYFPAGRYIISDTIKIPTYALLAGEGKNSTIIRMQTNPNSTTHVVRVADSQQQVGLNIGNNSAVPPAYIDVRDMTFETIEDISILLVEQAHHCTFSNVGLYGAVDSPSDIGAATHGFSATSTPVLQSYAIAFDKCSFAGTTYSVVLDDDVQNIVFNACDFSEHYIGFKIGQDTGVDPLIQYGPRSVRVTNSLFKRIARNGIIVYTPVHGFSSAFNFFQDVGNQYAGSGNPASPVITFESTDNTSFGDYFERPDADDKQFSRVSNTGSPTLVQYPSELRMGSLRQSFGGELELSANAFSTSTGITFDYSVSQSYTMDYTIEHDGNYRHGTMRIVGTNVDEEYTESDMSNASYNFYINLEETTATLLYDGYASGVNNPKMKYAVRYFGLPPSVVEVPQ